MKMIWRAPAYLREKKTLRWDGLKPLLPLLSMKLLLSPYTEML
jgi:hypothetical protein